MGMSQRHPKGRVSAMASHSLMRQQRGSTWDQLATMEAAPTSRRCSRRHASAIHL